jgi:hypothetical protein
VRESKRKIEGKRKNKTVKARVVLGKTRVSDK